MAEYYPPWNLPEVKAAFAQDVLTEACGNYIVKDLPTLLQKMTGSADGYGTVELTDKVWAGAFVPFHFTLESSSPKPPPAKPAPPTVTISGRSASIAWSTVPSAVEYRVQGRPSGGGWMDYTWQSATTLYVVLSPGTYEFGVQGRSAVGEGDSFRCHNCQRRIRPSPHSLDDPHGRQEATPWRLDVEVHHEEDVRG